MSKSKKQYICNNCGSISSKWSGQCFDCQSWGTINEEVVSQQQVTIARTGNVLNVEEFDNLINERMRIVTPISELNRVLGGGLVPASAILIGGDPGIGKSTLLLQLTTRLSSSGVKCLYVTGEESANQVKLRASRLGLNTQGGQILAATNLHDILATIDSAKNNIDLVVIDSIQTIYSGDFSSAPGTVSQIRAAAHELINYAKRNDIILLIVGHVTKDGQIAGPKVLEHMVDTVLYFEGDPSYHFRILRSMKNRFGGVNEIGVFEMTGSGLVEVSNPSQLFLMERESNVSGTSVFAGIEGSRPVLVEVQALIAPSNMPTPRRSVVGWDANRLSMILAVLAVRYGLNLSSHEVYLSIAGGIKITEPAMDLAVAAALISAALNKPLPEASIFFGEVGLSGEVRKVNGADVRIKEAIKLGFGKMVCAQHSNIEDSNVTTISHIKQLKGIF
ncbi:MAG: DNA repair protein RadA [Rickettsiaceae bacterium]|nr:DNA repair protein RadA [Rickettsiaceae bacterium]